jgi:transposase-like protein
MYRDHPASEVAERFGVPEGTIRRWAQEARDRDGGDPLPADATEDQRAKWAAKKEAAAEESFATAQQALAEVRRLMADGKHLEAQRAALTFAITTDKSGVLEEAAAQADEREAALSRKHGQIVAEVIVLTLVDLGLPAETAAPVIRHYLEQAAAGDPLTHPAPGAEDARQAVAAQILARRERSLPSERQLALPPGQRPSPRNMRAEDDDG